MTTQQNSRATETETISDEAVEHYLRTNPDFFERHPTLLSVLSLPHAQRGTVSLVERQLQVLRQRNAKLERKLRDLISTARANDLLSKKVHKLTARLIGASDLNGVLEALASSLHEDFGADEFTLVLFQDDPGSGDLFEARYLRRARREAPELESFRNFLAGKAPRCGRVSDAQRDFLFGDAERPVASAALTPMEGKSEHGFLAVGSYDETRFHPGVSTDFLASIGNLVGHALRAADGE